MTTQQYFDLRSMMGDRGMNDRQRQAITAAVERIDRTETVLMNVGRAARVAGNKTEILSAIVKLISDCEENK